MIITPETLYLLSFLSGLALVVFGIQKLSLGLQSLFASWIRKAISSLNTNPIVTFFLGLVITFFIQSGSSISTMSLSYASSGLLSFHQLVALFLSSHFSTLPLLSFFTFDLHVISLLFITIGFLPMMATRYAKASGLGQVLFSLGVMGLGYLLMTQQFQGARALLSWDMPIHSSQLIFWSLTLLMVLASLCVRSTMALLIALMSLIQIGALSQVTVFIMVLGLNLGKATTVFLLSSKKNITPRQGALFYWLTHFLFVLLVSFSFQHFYFLAQSLQKTFFDSTLSFIITSQLLFCVGHLFLTLGLFVPIKKLSEFCIRPKEKKEPQKLIYSGPTQWISPVLGIEQVRYEIKKMSATISSCLGLTKIYLSEQDEPARSKVIKYEKVTDHMQKEVFEYLDRVKEVALNRIQGQTVRSFSRVADELESIADDCKMMVMTLQEGQKSGATFDRELKLEFEKLFEVLIDLYDVVFTKITSPEAKKQDLTLEYRKKLSQFDQRLLDLRNHYLQWLKQNASSLYEADAGLRFNDVLNSLRKIKSHTKNIYENSILI